MSSDLPTPVRNATTSNRWTGRAFRATGSIFTWLGPLLALATVFAIFALADQLQDGENSFRTVYNARLMALQAAPVAVAALGMTIIIISGGIDLSAGTGLALCATVVAWCLKEDYSAFVSLSAGIATGILAGALNGVLISTLRVVPFIVTLGTMTVYLGVAKIIADETTVRPSLAQTPVWLEHLRRPAPEMEYLILPQIPNFALGVWFALLLALITSILLRLTVFGRHVFALGSNESTARLCGVNVPAAKIAIYALGGLFVGIAGIYQFAKLSAGNPTSGMGQELRIIAAVVIGGGSLSGGRGSVLGTLTGAAMMAVIANGCTMLGLRNPIQDILIGAIIVGAVTLDQLRQGRISFAFFRRLFSGTIRREGNHD